MQLENDTAWYVSERLGYDAKTTAEGRKAINLEMARIISNGFGAWAAQQARLLTEQKLTSVSEADAKKWESELQHHDH